MCTGQGETELEYFSPRTNSGIGRLCGIARYFRVLLVTMTFVFYGRAEGKQRLVLRDRTTELESFQRLTDPARLLLTTVLTTAQ